MASKKRNAKKDLDENYVPKAFRKGRGENKKNIKLDEDVPRSKRKKKVTKFKKLKKRVLMICFLLIIFLGVTLGISSHRWKILAKEMLSNKSSIVVDSKDNEIASLGCERKRKTIKLNDMPDNLKNAYVAIEDERFYKHGGIDIKRTGAAIVSYIFHFGKSSYGGSTITQQLVKNLTGDSTDSITRKVKEWWKAWQLETRLSKDEILEGYLNIIYVGPNMYGVEIASKYYFNKTVSDLKLEECAFLAGINNSPNSYNPFEGKDNNEKIKKRTKIVLNKMKELNYIDEAKCNEALENVEKGLNFKKGQIESKEAIYSYHTDALFLELIDDISKKYKISKTFAENYIEMAGLKIHSAQDSNVQEKIETEFEKSKYKLISKNGGDSSQAAMVILDHKTGNVLGCVGGLGKKTKARSLNRATQSIRQTGSAIKPLSVLIPGIDKRIITASSIYDDTERDFENEYHPTDYNPPLGKITVRRAVESSQNIPFVEIMEKIKPKTAIKYMQKMGISTLTKTDDALVLALGGLQKGISPLEMAGAYATIANDGQYIEPTFYINAENNEGKVILNPRQNKRRVISKEVAYIVKEILTQPVVGNSGTATYCKITGVDVAAKTGTTDENYDRWLCGFTPYYTAVTWYGYDQNESINYNKRNPAGLLWANVMSRVHAGLKGAKFEKPNSVRSCTICAETGKKATTGCKNTYKEYFLWLTEPSLCDKHSGAELKDEKDNGVKDKIQEVIEGITQDIDAVDPQQVLPNNFENNTNNSNTVTTNNSNTIDNTVSNTTNTIQNTTTTNSLNNINTTNTQSNTINNNSTNSQATNSTIVTNTETNSVVQNANELN